MLEVADALLVFWRQGTGEELAQVNPVLGELWESAASLLASFEVKRFERSLSACWEARTDAARLAVAIEDLQPEGNRRVEFARCLYHLELARMFVDSSRQAFAKRVALLSEAYQSPEVATQLVGNDEGLKFLWAEIVPYLDEFFEGLEEAAAKRAKASARSEVKTDPSLVAAPVGEAREVPSFRTLTRPPHLTPRGGVRAVSADDITPPAVPAVPPGETLDDDVIEAVLEADELPPPPPDLTPPGSWRPPRPPNLTPPGAFRPPPRPPVDELEIIDAVEVVSAPPRPPPPPNLTPVRGVQAGVIEELGVDDFDEAPDAATLGFWDHTFETLGLLPDGETGRSARLLSCDSRTDRKRLVEFVDTLEPFHDVPEARSFACLIRLMMAGQTREKSLFGQPNPRRAEALAAALPFLAASPLSAAHAAVWFELDGPQTQEALHRGLELLVGYLAWCHRAQKDPLSDETMAKFTHQ